MVVLQLLLLIKLEFGDVAFEERGKSEYPEKNLSE